MTNEERRALDAEVAEKVMGWLVVVPDGGKEWYERQVTRWPCLIQHREGGQWLTRAGPGQDEHDEHFSPSTDIAAAWLVVEQLRERGLHVDIHSNTDGWWCAVVENPGNPLSGKYTQSDGHEPAALAICRAALKAVAVNGVPA